MCLGCRRRVPQTELVRFIAILRGRSLMLVRDDGATRTGRGLYTCADPECFTRAVERRAFPRAARGNVVVDPAMADSMADEMRTRQA